MTSQPACRTCQRCAFCLLADDAWNSLERHAPLRTVRPAVVLFRQGEQPAGVHLICGGRLKQWCLDEQGRWFLWRYIEVGEVLGAITLMRGKPYPTTVETAETCLIRYLGKELFFRILQDHREIERQLLLQTGARLYDTVELLRGFALSRSALGRLALLLYRLWAERQGSWASGEPVRIDLSREELAERIGVESVETVSRLLGKLAEAGLIARERGVTIILEPERLKLVE